MIVWESHYLADVVMNFLSSGFVGLLAFLLIWTISGKYLVWKNRLTSRISLEEHYTLRLYLSCMVSLQAALLLHMHIDRKDLGGVWIYLENELREVYHPYVGIITLMIVIAVIISGLVARRLK